jgi:HEAT repeat protein
MAKQVQCPKCGGKIQFDASPPTSCPHCSVNFRAQKRRVTPPGPLGGAPQSDAAPLVRDLVTTEPLQPSVAEYAVLAVCALLMVSAVTFTAIGGQSPREITTLGERLEDTAAFPELARVLQPTDGEVAEQVHEAQRRASVTELVATLQEIAEGTSRLGPPQQLIYLKESVRDLRPEVARAAVQAADKFESGDAESVLLEAVVHPDESVRKAALDAAVARNDESGAAVVLQGWKQAFEADGATAVYLEALRQLDPAPVEAELWSQPEHPPEHPDLVTYLAERGSVESARQWLSARAGPDPIDPDHDSIDAAIAAIWDREVSGAAEAIELTGGAVRIGDSPPVPDAQFLLLPPPLVATVLMSAWRVAEDPDPVLNLVAQLRDDQMAAIIERLSSPSAPTRDAAAGLLQARVGPAVFETLYQLAEGPTETSLPASVVIHSQAEKIRNRGELPAEQLAQVALVTLRFPSSGAAIGSALSMVDENAPAAQREQLIRGTIPMLILPDAVAIHGGLQLQSWRTLLCLDPQQMLPLLEPELTGTNARRKLDVMVALIRCQHPDVRQWLVEGLSDDSLRPACQVCLRYAGSDVEPLILEAIRSPGASDAVLAAGCEILRWIGTDESWEDLHRLLARNPAVSEVAGIAETSIQQRRGRKVPLSEPSRRVLFDQYREIGARLRLNAVPAGDPRAVVDEGIAQIRSRDAETRRQGAFRLLRCELVAERRAAAMSALQKTIDTTDTPLCWFALQACGRWSGEDAVPLLIPHLQSDNQYLVAAASIALADIASEAALTPLLELLQTPGREVSGRLAITRAGQSQPQRVIQMVTPLLSSDNRRTRIEAAAALAMLGQPEGLPAVEQAVQADPVTAVLWPDLKRRHALSEQLRSKAGESQQ